MLTLTAEAAWRPRKVFDMVVEAMAAGGWLVGRMGKGARRKTEWERISGLGFILSDLGAFPETKDGGFIWIDGI